MPLKTVKVQTMYAYKRGMPLPKQQMEFQALLSLLGKSFELCCVCLVMGWCGACRACVSLYRAAEGKSCTLLRYCKCPEPEPQQACASYTMDSSFQKVCF